MVDGAPAYTVKHLLDVLQVCDGVQYLVDWEGYRPEEWSWVPFRHILDRELIRAFRQDRVADLGATPSGGEGGFKTCLRALTMHFRTFNPPPGDTLWYHGNMLTTLCFISCCSIQPAPGCSSPQLTAFNTVRRRGGENHQHPAGTRQRKEVALE
ncbi:hypothetical protein P4O66_001546 [Electrophorus voltai]|uniref:Chromo domain-containing protein n=1 Tax=Electrophorus voltai TaxID=2609070 RepID=A0AAD8Z9M5_9TELE|nr:hypothetical protein P4O66_001546 [Electrophorus voltai]